MTTRSSRPPPTPQELILRREQLVRVLSKTSASDERRLLEQELEELDDTLQGVLPGEPLPRLA